MKVKEKNTFTRMGSLAAKINNVAVYLLVFCLLFVFIKYVLYVQYSLKQKPLIDGYITRSIVYIPWKTPGVELIKVDFVVKNKHLQKSIANNYSIKSHVINRAFDSLNIRGTFFNKESDTLYSVLFFPDLDFIKNEAQQKELQRRIQDIHLVIIDEKNKAWCLSRSADADDHVSD